MGKKYHPIFVLLLFFWEFPQNMLGLIILAIWKAKGNVLKIEKAGHRRFIETPRTGVSLGWMVFWTPSGNRFARYTNDCLMHEYGHSLQSVMLGPLYLLVIGIPSISRNIYGRWHKRKHGCNWKFYFDGFPENWADKLGGVIV